MSQSIAKETYIINSVVERVEERFLSRYDYGFGKDAVFSNHSLGWFVHLRGSYESLYLGKERPKLLQGQSVKITIEVK